jgi:hypothetical protein
MGVPAALTTVLRRLVLTNRKFPIFLRSTVPAKSKERTGEIE